MAIMLFLFAPIMHVCVSHGSGRLALFDAILFVLKAVVVSDVVHKMWSMESLMIACGHSHRIKWCSELANRHCSQAVKSNYTCFSETLVYNSILAYWARSQRSSDSATRTKHEQFSCILCAIAAVGCVVGTGHGDAHSIEHK